jgi:hypothetical protein
MQLMGIASLYPSYALRYARDESDREDDGQVEK